MSEIDNEVRNWHKVTPDDEADRIEEIASRVNAAIEGKGIDEITGKIEAVLDKAVVDGLICNGLFNGEVNARLPGAVREHEITFNASDVGDFEYYLGFRGQITNDNLVERYLGIKERDFWFPTSNDRSEFKAKLIGFAETHKVTIAFKEEEGNQVRFRTIARMVMALPDGREFPYEYDFGYDFGEDSARFMFFDGNYSCDCNKTIFLSEKHPEIEEWDCGDKIELRDFKVSLEP
jgi:hypothetical protein